MEHFGWRSVDDVLTWSAGDVAAVSRSSDVLKVPVDAALGGPEQVFIKRYHYKSFGQRARQAFRGTLFGKSRARREFEFLNEMRRREIAAIRPIAYGEAYGRAFLHAGFLITEGVKGFHSLDRFAIHALRKPHFDRNQKNTLLRELALTIRKMHEAGVYHGGLFWRNILVRPREVGAFDLLLLDPDSQGHIGKTPVSPASSAADLSDLVASAMAFGLRAGLKTFLKAYFNTQCLTATHMQLASRIVRRARSLAGSERRRMAAARLIEWLHRRVVRANVDGDAAHKCRSVDDFFEQITAHELTSTPPTTEPKTVRFVFSSLNGPKDILDRTVVLNGHQVSVSAKHTHQQDLLIHTDPDTWCAVASGYPDAYARIHAGRLRMKGDTTLLPALMERLDHAESPIAY